MLTSGSFGAVIAVTYPMHRHPPPTGRQPDARSAACGAGSPSVTPSSMMDSILHDTPTEPGGLRARKAHGFLRSQPTCLE